MSDILVVREFVDVFPEELPSFPLAREVEFGINELLGTMTISRVQYQKAPLELWEIKTQLHELMEEGFIHPSISPYGTPALFVMKNDNSMRLCIDY